MYALIKKILLAVVILVLLVVLLYYAESYYYYRPVTKGEMVSHGKEQELCFCDSGCDSNGEQCQWIIHRYDKLKKEGVIQNEIVSYYPRFTEPDEVKLKFNDFGENGCVTEYGSIGNIKYLNIFGFSQKDESKIVSRVVLIDKLPDLIEMVGQEETYDYLNDTCIFTIPNKW
ncbi:MAG: hypothetical protein ACWA5R_13985 [bacterium]